MWDTVKNRINNSAFLSKFKTFLKNKISMRTISILWILFLWIDIRLSTDVFPFRLSAGPFMAALIILVSVSIILCNLIRKPRHIFLAICVFCMLSCLLLYTYLIFSYEDIYNPFTTEQFATRWQTNLLSKGDAIYYRRIGPFLIRLRKSEYGDLGYDHNHIHVTKSCIYLNSFFSFGTYIDASHDAIRLRDHNIQEWEISRSKNNVQETFLISGDSPHTLTYSNSTEKYDVKYILNDTEYMNLTKILRYLPLADTSQYELDIQIQSDPYGSYCASVEGQDVFDKMMYLVNPS